MLGVEKTLETIVDLQAVAVDAVGLAKAATRGPLGFGAVLAGVLRVAADVKALVGDAPLALPELKDIDALESGKIATAAYDCVKAVVAALAA